MLTNVIGVWIVECIHNSWMLFPSTINNSSSLPYTCFVERNRNVLKINFLIEINVNQENNIIT